MPLLKSKIDDIKPLRIVALGKTAEKALTLLGIPHFAMPHPSGRNRQLNDPEYLSKKIKGLQNYCNPSSDF